MDRYACSNGSYRVSDRQNTSNHSRRGMCRRRTILLWWMVIIAVCGGGWYVAEAIRVDDSLVRHMPSHDDIVVAGGIDGRVYAINAWTGNVMWMFDSGGPMVDTSNCGGRPPQPPPNSGSESNPANVDVEVDGDGTTVAALSTSETARDVARIRASLAEMVPFYDGRLYHMADSVVRELDMTMADLIHTNGPVRLVVDPEPQPSTTTRQDILLFGEKETKIFLLNPTNGQIQPYFTHHGTRRPTDMVFGRTEFKTKAMHPQNTSMTRCFTIAEYFLQFTDQSQRCSVMETSSSSSDQFPQLVVDGGREGESILTALDPLTQQVLWEWKVDQFTMIAVYGIRMNQASTFYQWHLPGPSSSSLTSTTKTSQLTVRPIDTINTPSIHRYLESKSKSKSEPASESESHEEPSWYGRFHEEEVYTPTPTPSSRRVFWEPMENQHGTRGVFITYSHVAGMVIGVLLSCFLVAWGCYVKGLSAALAQSALKRLEQPHYVVVHTLTIALPGREEKRSRSSNPLLFPFPLLEGGEGVENTTTATEGALMEQLSRMTAIQETPPPPPYPLLTSDDVWILRDEHGNRIPRIEEVVEESSSSSSSTINNQWEEEEPIVTTSSTSSSFSTIVPTPPPTTTTSDPTVLFPFVCQSRFANEFVQGSALGKGGFGQVILAENRLDGRHYAIKRVGLYLQHQTSKTLQKFLREVKILALLDHPNIVRYYQAWLEKIEEEEEVDKRSIVSESHPYSMSNLLAPISELESSSHSFEEEDDGGFEWERSEHEEMLEWKEEEVVIPLKPKRPTCPLPSPFMEQEDSSCYAKDRQDHWLYIQMQYCAGRNLGDYLALSTRTLVLSKILKIFTQIASAIAHVHSCGLIHRDLKPANIFVADMDGESIKLGDFGLSRYAANVLPTKEEETNGTVVNYSNWNTSVWSNVSESGEITAGVGTYLYASPEQVAGKKYDAKTDMYSLGMILFELCHPCFSTTMERYVTLRNARERVYSVEFGWNGQYPQVQEMLDRLLHVEPHLRPDASEVVEWSQELYEWSLMQQQTPLSSSSSMRSPLHNGRSYHPNGVDPFSLGSSSIFSMHVETGMETPVPSTTTTNSMEETERRLPNHNLLKEVCDLIATVSEGRMEIKKCGLHLQDGGAQILEFVLDPHGEEDKTKEMSHEQLIKAIEALPGVRTVRIGF